MKALLTTVVCLLAALSAWAQGKVSGLILEKPQSPASFATVVLVAVADSAQVKARLTDENGVFTLDGIPDGTYCLRISYMGFLPKTTEAFALNATTPVRELGSIQLVENVKVLSEVVVKSQKPLLERKSDRLVMNLANSPISLGRNASELLGVMPLVAVGPDGGISLRGKSGVLVLIDGRPQQGGLQAVLEAMPADDIARIEVITNPSARYDASATGGVINIITRQSEKRGLTGSTRLTASQGFRPQLHTLGGTMTYRAQKLSLLGQYFFANRQLYNDETGYRAFRNDPLALIDDNTQTRGRVVSHNLRLNADWQVAKNHLLSFTASRNLSDTRRDMNTTTGFVNTSNITDSTYRTDAIWDINRRTDNYSVMYRGTLDSVGRELTVIGTYTPFASSTDQTFGINVFDRRNELRGPRQFLRSFNPVSINITVAQADYSHPTRGNWSFVSGLKRVRVATNNTLRQETLIDGTWRFNPAISNQMAYEENVTAGYLMSSLKAKAVTMQLGMRAEHTLADVRGLRSFNYLSWFPSVFLQKEVAAGRQLSLSYSRRITRPAYDDMVPFYRLYDRFTASEGNPLLRPQFDDVVELNYSLGGVNMLFGYTYIQDFMSWTPRQDVATRTTVYAQRNLDRVNRLNLALSHSHSPLKWWQLSYSGWVNYDRVEANALPGVPSYNARQLYGGFNLSSLFTLTNGWKAELTANYYTPGRTGVYQEQSIHMINLGVTRPVLAGRGTLKLWANDITRGNVFRTTINYPTVEIFSRTYSDSRRVGLTLLYNFGKKTVDQLNEKKLGNESETGRL